MYSGKIAVPPGGGGIVGKKRQIFIVHCLTGIQKVMVRLIPI
jgi:hypothetical protein